jgi:hypothetical protein
MKCAIKVAYQTHSTRRQDEGQSRARKYLASRTRAGVAAQLTLLGDDSRRCCPLGWLWKTRLAAIPTSKSFEELVSVCIRFSWC